jgi:hypothetical protein
VHRVEQVPCKVAQRVVKHGHGLGRERKPRVGITDNGADGQDLLSCIGEWLRAIAGDRGALGRQLIYYDPKCEMAHRQEPFSLVVLNEWPPLGGCSSAAGRWFSFSEDCHARFQSHGHYGVALSHS